MFQSREGLFGRTPTEYDQILRVRKAVEPYVNLWATAREWTLSYEAWTKGSFLAIDAETLEADVERWVKLAGLVRLVRLVGFLGGVLRVCCRPRTGGCRKMGLTVGLDSRGRRQGTQVTGKIGFRTYRVIDNKTRGVFRGGRREVGGVGGVGLPPSSSKGQDAPPSTYLGRKSRVKMGDFPTCLLANAFFRGFRRDYESLDKVVYGFRGEAEQTAGGRYAQGPFVFECG